MMESKSQKLTPEMILDILKKFEYLNRKDTVICHTKWYSQVEKIINDNGLQDRCSVKADDYCSEDKFLIVDQKEAERIKFVEPITDTDVEELNEFCRYYWTLR